MAFFDRLPLSQKLALLGLVFTLAFGGFAFEAWRTVGEVGVNGPVYTRIVRMKDLVADVLPPPEYILESHLIAHQAVSTTDPETRRELVARFTQLESDFDARHAHWLEELPSGSLRESLTARSYAPAHEYFETARRELVPALESGDQARARLVLDGRLEALYASHRAAIDDTVELANVAAASEERSANETMQRALYVLAALAALVVGVLLIAARIVQRATADLQAQIASITAVARRVADGDLSPVAATVAAADTADLTDAIRAMTVSLSSLVTRVKQASITLTTTAGQLAGASRDQDGLVQTLSSSTAETAATTKEISATSQSLQKTMEEVAGLSVRAADVAESGRVGLGQMRTSVESLEKATINVSDKLSTIRDRATDITGVVTTMSKVAEQTNLLSVNAAIEAEKAGEQGRGFLVVAREIRRLADQSAVASLDIEHMVRQMQSAVGSGVMEMDRFAEHVRRVATTTSGVADQLGEVIERMQSLTTRIESASEGMQAQALGAKQISEAMAMLKDGASQTAAVVTDLKLASGGLEQAVSSLREDVSRFSVG